MEVPACVNRHYLGLLDRHSHGRLLVLGRQGGVLLHEYALLLLLLRLLLLLLRLHEWIHLDVRLLADQPPGS